MTAERVVHADGWSVRLDVGGQVLRLEVPEPVAHWDLGGRSADAPLSPVLPVSVDGPVSAATLLLKAKQFDDRLYAAVELAAQHDAGRFTGKGTLLRSLATTLAGELPEAGQSAATVILTACQLGGMQVAVPDLVAEAVRAAKDDFLRDETQSRPLGFYTWTPALSAIFRQDRFLQRPLTPTCAGEMARALEQTPGASDAHAASLRLNERLTNPAIRMTKWDAGMCPPFFPASRSHEVSLFQELFEDGLIPEGFDLMGELIRRVRSGAVRLMPREDSGWYDHQTWSLEPLLRPDRTPESARLELGKRYRKHLEDLFRGTLALVRETHVKQAGGGRGGYGGPTRRPILVDPGLTVEPLRTVYARRAASYRFVRMVLEEAFGSEALNGLPRITPEGVTAPGLAEELAWIEQLFMGASAAASCELGMGMPSGSEAAARDFSAWRSKLPSDPDVSRDARMMVPVFYDVARMKTKVWAFLGWRTVPVSAEYRTPPVVVSVAPSRPEGKSASAPPQVLFSGERYEFAVPVISEVYVSRLMDRDEFRRHCDRFKSRHAILANLR